MKYLLLIYENEKRFEKDGYPPGELAEYRAFGAEMAGKILGGNALQPTRTATTVRIREGKRLTNDGPFAETREQLGGFYLIDVADMDEALAAAAKLPAARYGAIEVRPIVIFA